MARKKIEQNIDLAADLSNVDDKAKDVEEEDVVVAPAEEEDIPVIDLSVVTNAAIEEGLADGELAEDSLGPEDDPTYVPPGSVARPPLDLLSTHAGDLSPAQRGTPLSQRISMNDLGLTPTDDDDCYHLNKSWKGGVCTISGNKPCPFLGGAQEACEIYVELEAGRQQFMRVR